MKEGKEGRVREGKVRLAGILIKGEENRVVRPPPYPLAPYHDPFQKESTRSVLMGHVPQS
jgi:hypothetical protein